MKQHKLTDYPSVPYHLVAEMHEKFQIDYQGPPRHLSAEEKKFRIDAMCEELEEYFTAETLTQEYDALLDLLVFTLGTLYLHGFPVAHGFAAVMSANMTKLLGPNAKRGSFKQDLVKPADFMAPDKELEFILKELSERYGDLPDAED